MDKIVKYPISTIAAICLTLSGTIFAQTSDTLTAEQSDPANLSWMNGFPPPADKVIRFTDPDYFAFPKLRWTVCNFRQLMPTTDVRNSPNDMRLLPVELDPGIDTVQFMPLGGEALMTWDNAFDTNYTDGLLVLHHGRIVYERYTGCLDENTLHGVMSVTKSFTGLIGETLVAQGILDENANVGKLIPELSDSAFGDATVKQILEMTTALDYSEDYSDPEADVWAYGLAGSPLPPPADYNWPRSYFAFLETVKKTGEHGDAFGYRTINADALGWLIARATGRSVAEWLSNNIWTQIGTERESFYTVDSIGTPFAGGGLNATLRDAGRFGQLVLNNGEMEGQQIIPAEAIARLQQGGDKQAFAKAGYSTLEGWSYRSMWWVSHDEHGAFAARGVHGQTIWIDPLADMVIVRFASHPVAGNATNDPTSLPAYRAVADYLMAQDTHPQLVGREWIIEDIDGHGVIDNSPASLLFLPNGTLPGDASCNRIIGTYEQKKQSIMIENTGTTMMLCPEAVQNQERLLLELLATIEKFSIDNTGALVLHTSDNKSILARRR